MLVVDDDVLVARAFAMVLATTFEVILAYDGDEALSRIEAGDRFDAILCDLMMPRLGGMGLYERLHARGDPHLARIVFVTGGAVTAESRAFLGRIPNRCLEKPPYPDELRAAIDLVIGGP